MTKQQRLTQIYVYVMFSLFLFFTGFKGYTAIFSAKCVAFTTLSLIYVLLSIIFKIKIKESGFWEKAAAVYLVITAISALSSKYFPKTLVGVSRYEGLLTIGIYVLVFICVSQNWKKDSLFVPFLSIAMILESLVVILQLMGYNALWLFPKGENYYVALEKYNGAFISTIGNADIASAFFSLTCPILSVLVIGYKKYRYLTLPASVMTLFCTLFMSVSAGIAALIATAFVLPTVIYKDKRKTVITILALIAVIAVFTVYFLPLTNGAVFELQALMRGNFDSDFGSGRIHIWKEVIKNTKPLLGSGPDTMLFEGIEPFTKTVGDKTITRYIDIAHNDYLNILFHQGIFALISYVAILSVLIKWFKNGKSNILVTALGAGIFAYCVQTFFSFSACSAAAFFWILLGVFNSESTEITKKAASSRWQCSPIATSIYSQSKPNGEVDLM